MQARSQAHLPIQLQLDTYAGITRVNQTLQWSSTKRKPHIRCVTSEEERTRLPGGLGPRKKKRKKFNQKFQ